MKTKKNYGPRISILTPTWNREKYLGRVFAGLQSQSYKDFEWIVGNDGSDDNTVNAVACFGEKAEFDLSLINASLRIGKSCMDNLLVKAARGELIVWCDSDDQLKSDALQQLINAWDSIPLVEQAQYCGVCALAETEHGVLGAALDASMDGRTWNEIYGKLNADLTIMTRTDLLKKNPFLEIDFLIPETSVWNIIGTKRARFINHPLLLKYYKQQNSLSFTGKMQYNRGRAYALGQNYQYVKDNIGLRGEFVRAMNFIRYCVHGDLTLSTAKKIWTGSFISQLMLVLGALPAIVLVIRDRLRGVVEKTHIEFERNHFQVHLSRMSWCDGKPC